MPFKGAFTSLERIIELFFIFLIEFCLIFLFGRCNYLLRLDLPSLPTSFETVLAPFTPKFTPLLIVP